MGQGLHTTPSLHSDYTKFTKGNQLKRSIFETNHLQNDFSTYAKQQHKCKYECNLPIERVDISDGFFGFWYLVVLLQPTTQQLGMMNNGFR